MAQFQRTNTKITQTNATAASLTASSTSSLTPRSEQTSNADEIDRQFERWHSLWDYSHLGYDQIDLHY